MKRRWGYDPEFGFLFSWNREFRFEGKVGDVDSIGWYDVDVVESENRQMTEVAGCMFLSGCRRNCLALRVDDLEDVVGMVGMFRGRARTVRGGLESMQPFVVPSGPVLMCGPAVKDPDKVARFCRVFPTSTVYVCPLVDELAAFGALALGLPEEKPRQVNLFISNTEPLDGVAVEFDSKLDGDGLGRMAHAVKMGAKVMNEMMVGPGLPRFYGQVVSDGMGGSETYVVRMRAMDGFFPLEPISAKSYAAMYVPVRMTNTHEFSKATWCEATSVNVLVVSDRIWELPTFERFYNVMTGRSVFGVSTPKDVDKARTQMAVFRNNKGYRYVERIV